MFVVEAVVGSDEAVIGKTRLTYESIGVMLFSPYSYDANELAGVSRSTLVSFSEIDTSLQLNYDHSSGLYLIVFISQQGYI